ncbi:MAG: uroporphyrinogen-III synthase [Candidatus Acidiferrales bacterium]
MPNEQKGLTGLRVLSLESRRAEEMAKLIENYGGEAVVAPSMREVPLESNTEALEFARRLAAGDFEVVIFLTGTGTRALARVVETVYSREEFIAHLKRATIVARGPKPFSVLKEFGVPVAVNVPEPNTSRDLLDSLDRKKIVIRDKGVAVQEYGEPNAELLAGLLDRGAKVMQVPVYKWELPQNTEALVEAVRRIGNGEIDMALFTTSMQIVHLLRFSKQTGEEDRVRAALAEMTVGSIGPVTSEGLRGQGIHVDFEPEHPKMGYLVNEAARRMSAGKT